MKVGKMYNTLQEVPQTDQNLAANGKWRHFNRVYILETIDHRFHDVRLNIFERMLNKFTNIYFGTDTPVKIKKPASQPLVQGASSSNGDLGDTLINFDQEAEKLLAGLELDEKSRDEFLMLYKEVKQTSDPFLSVDDNNDSEALMDALVYLYDTEVIKDVGYNKQDRTYILKLQDGPTPTDFAQVEWLSKGDIK